MIITTIDTVDKYAHGSHTWCGNAHTDHQKGNISAWIHLIWFNGQAQRLLVSMSHKRRKRRFASIVFSHARSRGWDNRSACQKVSRRRNTKRKDETSIEFRRLSMFYSHDVVHACDFIGKIMFDSSFNLVDSSRRRTKATIHNIVRLAEWNYLESKPNWCSSFSNEGTRSVTVVAGGGGRTSRDFLSFVLSLSIIFSHAQQQNKRRRRRDEGTDWTTIERTDRQTRGEKKTIEGNTSGRGQNTEQQQWSIEWENRKGQHDGDRNDYQYMSNGTVRGEKSSGRSLSSPCHHGPSHFLSFFSAHQQLN